MTDDIKFERIVTVLPAYDMRDPDPEKNCGIGACRIRCVLKGPHGAVQFMVSTSWYLPSAAEFLRSRGWPSGQHDKPEKPDGWDVGYHSPKPMYKGQDKQKCDLLDGGKCYTDGSGLLADKWVPDFIAGGTDWLWPRLERYYRATLLGEARVEASPVNE